MDIDKILWILCAWLTINALFPLILNSIERQFQSQIDTAVIRALRTTRKILLKTLQILLVVVIWPNMIIYWIVHKIAPEFSESNMSMKEIKNILDSVLDHEFPRLLVSNFKPK